MVRRKCRLGLIGAGGIAQSYAQAIANSELVEVAGVADLRTVAAAALGEVLRCPAFDTHEELLREREVDAVLICTPPNSHAGICLDAIGRGLHVMCEKPFTTDSFSARAVVKEAEASGVVVMMASKFRYVNDVIRAKGIIASGILGDVVLYENAFTAKVDMSSRWNSDPSVAGGGVLIDNGTHSLDILRYLLGPIAEVQVIEGRKTHPVEVEETAYVFARTESGAVACIDLSWAIQKELENYITIHGSHGTVCIGWKTSKYRQSASPEWIHFGKGYQKVECLRAQVHNFVRAIWREEAPLITPEDALTSVEVVETAYEALRRNAWVRVGAAATADVL